ncbi:MAG TPA: N-acetyltransferase [Candidatus Acidoferrum sp.]|nr:N-acetyltransferase [Candidatus Acidoferrum sp.]
MPVPGLILRPYQTSDFDALVAMDQLCFPKTIAYGRREMKGYLQSEGSYCIVAEITAPANPKMLAGFILTERSGEFAHVITLDVLEPFRRQSIGSLLLQSAEQEADSHGVACMYLETATTNKAAIALWRKHGYRESGTIENYYGRGQNAIEMMKPIRLLPEGN